MSSNISNNSAWIWATSHQSSTNTLKNNGPRSGLQMAPGEKIQDHGRPRRAHDGGLCMMDGSTSGEYLDTLPCSLGVETHVVIFFRLICGL